MKWFFEGRIGRGAYFLFLISVGIIQQVGGYFYNDEQTMKATTSEGISLLITFILFTVIVLLVNLAINAKRWHDLGRSGYFSLLSIVPILDLFIFIYLVFKKGDPKKNKYGLPPKKLHF